SGGDDWTVRTWDLTKAKPAERFVPWSHLSHAYSVAFAPDDTTLASGSYDRVVRFWDLDRPQPRTRKYLKGDGVPVHAVAHSPDGKLIAAAGQSPKVRQWDAATGAPRTSLVGHPTWVSQVCYSPDGRRLLSASGKEVFLFEAARGGFLHRLTRHETNVLCVGFSPDGRRLLSGSGYYPTDKDGKYVYKDGKHGSTDCVVRVWDAEVGGETAVIKNAETGFYAAAFHPDGQTLWASNYDSRLRRWVAEGGKFVERLTDKGAFGNPATSILFSGDGRRVVTRGHGAQLVEWDA